MRCATCKFFDADNKQCRRHAPTATAEDRKWLALHDSELLRDIAFSLRVLANVETKPDPDEIDHDLHIEATESNFGDGTLSWPTVAEDDWCGEFQHKSSNGIPKPDAD